MYWNDWQESDNSETEASLKGTLLRFVRIIWPHRTLLLLAAIPSLLLSLLWLIPPVLIGRIIDDAILIGDTRRLVLFSVATVVVALLIIVMNITSIYLELLSGERLVRRMQVMLFEKLQDQSHRFFLRTDSGSITSRLWYDTYRVKAFIFEVISHSLGAAVLFASVLILMAFWNWKLALISVSFLPLVFIASFWVGRLLQKYMITEMDKHEEMVSFTAERFNINGFILLNGFGYEKGIDSKRFSRGTEDLARLHLLSNFTSHIPYAVAAIAPTMIAATVYLYGGMRVIGEETSLGVLVSFVALSTILGEKMVRLGELHIALSGSIAALGRFFQLMDSEPEVKDSPDAYDLGETLGHISFKDVSLEYEPGRLVVENLSFDIASGELVALVGPSGAGKTSITYLALRFYDPTSGSVKLDGRDLRDIRLSSLRRFTSIVPQESVVFHTTVRDNLLIAKPDATDEELVAACEAAQLHSLVESLPDGYQTVVGEMGYRLSGGERQRLAIARALLKRPRILIMDEPTSSLDSITERAIRDALASMRSEGSRPTTIVIAHRLSTILAADKILVLDEGRCIDSGTHKELLARCNLYLRLYEEQFAFQMAEALV
jgi:ATP-binding cassette subfamily B protein